MSEENKFQFPTERVDLPSEGLLYPKENPLSLGYVEMKYMTAKEEDILTNENYMKQGIAIDKLLQSLIVTPGVKVEDLLICDKNAVIIAARILGYGEKYNVSFFNPVSKKSEEVEVNLSELPVKKLDRSLIKENINEFEFTLPNTKNVVTFKLLSHGDSLKIDNEIKGLKKINPAGSFDVSTELKHILLSVNGNRDQKSIRDFVDNVLITRDSYELRKFINEITPDVLLQFSYDKDGYTKEGIPFRLGLDFFWPK